MRLEGVLEALDAAPIEEDFVAIGLNDSKPRFVIWIFLEYRSSF